MAGQSPNDARDIDDTGFSGHLDTLVRQIPEALCSVFLDGEGETVDLSTKQHDHFDARIAGAELAIVLHRVRETNRKLQFGETLEIRVEGTERSFITRHVSKGYDVLLLVQTPVLSARAAEMTAATAVALLVEAGLPPPPTYAVLRTTEQRPSRVGFAIPTALEEKGLRRRVEAVLGHVKEGHMIQFLVRLEDGEELVIMLEPATGRWRRA